MNTLLTIGLMLLTGYAAGALMDKIGLPKIIGYIAIGILFSPSSFGFSDPAIIDSTNGIMRICLSFIAFEVGGTLKWRKIKSRGRDILSITLFESTVPFILVAAGVAIYVTVFPLIPNLDFVSALAFGLMLGSLASPTDPTATFAVIHQYRVKGKVSDTILGVTAMDDAAGIMIFSFAAGFVALTTGNDVDSIFMNPVLNALYEIIGSILTGLVIGAILHLTTWSIQKESEGQLVVMVFALLIFCTGLTELLQLDEVLASMAMGVYVVNTSKQDKAIFGILQRYTEELIFLFFFLLSGLHLNVTTIPNAAPLILIFLILRTTGKFLGSNTGARLAHADPHVRKYTFGGLIPQGGIVIGLALSIYHLPLYHQFAEIMLTTIMGTTLINELIGPIASRYALGKAGELNQE